MFYRMNRTWVEINLDNIVHNYREFVQILSVHQPQKKVKIMGVVKANAYGHGAVTVSRTLLDAGADYLAVASLDEATELRKAGIQAPLLLLNHIGIDQCDSAVQYGLTQTVYDQRQADAVSEAAIHSKKRAKVHVKIDTGMTRVGLKWDEAVNEILKYARMPGIELEGIFTHFASADELDSTYTKMQFERYLWLIEKLKMKGLEIPLKHVCNSAAAIRYPQMHLDMIRSGIALYGCYPSDEVERSSISLKPVMAFKTKVIRINEVDAGASVSYGRIFTSKTRTRIATVPAGYADGYNRLLTGKAKVLINGQIARVIGKICMDQCMIDITGISGNVEVGDDVVLFGKQKDMEILSDDLASLIGTINYEIISSVARRVPRYYIRDGKIVSSENYLVR
ncbi:alanine racemase [Petroclostridium sp. X23]|uniref:alanine racemase n=1 Tax=Petroclostridium sp. X23 TaxID=3045146 RepID=UPI0024AE59CB|nr:alanine racemase [Petroclostridium sp. X23]WHH61247.1 alanine racemase [Petroclostridium sp. X23]